MAEPARMFVFEQERDDEAAIAAGRALDEGVRIAEALLFAASGPLDESAIAARLPDQWVMRDGQLRTRTHTDCPPP